MKVYEIRMNWYNHISGEDYAVEETKYIDLNTAKRAMLELIKTDDNLYEECAELKVSEDLMSAETKGSRDYCYYEICEVDIQIDNTISKPIPKDDVEDVITEIIEDAENDTLEINNNYKGGE